MGEERGRGLRTVEGIDVRVLAAHRLELRPGGWNHTRLPGSYWRLYQHDRPGGVLRVGTEADECLLEPERVYLIPSGLTLATRCDAPFRQFYLHFDLLGVPSIALRELFPGPVAVPPSAAFEASVAEIGVRAAGNWRGDLALACWIKGILCEAIGRYLSGLSPERLERYFLRLSDLSPILPALLAVQAGLGDRLSNADLADRCSMSEDHFIRQFRRIVGEPPAQYVTQRRVKQAAQLLLFTDLSMEQIAERCGFRDRFYFSRVFSRETGLPPARFRRGPRT